MNTARKTAALLAFLAACLVPAVASAAEPAECSDAAIEAVLEIGVGGEDYDDYADAAWVCEAKGERVVWAEYAAWMAGVELESFLGLTTDRAPRREGTL